MLCEKCHAAEGDQIWTESALSYVHGAYQHWCGRCVVVAQLAFCRDAAGRIPSLQAKLDAIDAIQLPK